jgi:hypothetical protein
MKKQTKSLLEELQHLSDNRDINYIIENRASNIIASAIHLIERMETHYPSEKAAVLEKKLLNAIRARDPEKFTRTLRKNSDNDEKK